MRYVMIIFSLFTYSLKAWGQLRNHHNYINTQVQNFYSNKVKKSSSSSSVTIIPW